MEIFTRQRIFRTFLILLIFSIQRDAFGALISSKSPGGDWQATSTWVGGKVPEAGDDVEISPGTNVTISGSFSCKSLTIPQSQQTAASLTFIGNGAKLNVAFDVRIYDGMELNVLAVGNGFLAVGQDLIVYGNGQRTGSLTLDNGTINIEGNLKFDGTNGQNVGAKIITVTGVGAIVSTDFIGEGSGTVTEGSRDNIFKRASYFKTSQDGDWSQEFNWLISSNNIDFYKSPTVPNGSASGILVNHIITLTTNSPAAFLTVKGTLRCGNFIINGPGPFKLDAGGKLETGHPQGIRLDIADLNGAIQVPSKEYSDKANYTFNGNVPQETGNGLPDYLKGILTVENTAASPLVTLSRPTVCSNLVLVKKGTLVSNGKLTLESTEFGDASLGQLHRGISDVSGDVNVRVFIFGGIRSNRLLSSPINYSASTDNAFKQLKKSIPITGPGGVHNGFDQGGDGQPYANTLNVWKEATPAGQTGFVPIPTIHQSLPAGTGFYAFFRGKQGGTYEANKSKLNRPYDIPENVVVTYSGPINKYDDPTPVSITNSTDGYNLIGNPYPSVIDFRKIHNSDLSDQLILIKPDGTQLSYTNLTGPNNIGATPFIQPGQAFFIRAKNASTFSFSESVKPSEVEYLELANLPRAKMKMSVEPSTIRESTDNVKLIKVALQNEQDTDETSIAFSRDWSATYDVNDVVYFSGSTVSLSTFSIDNQQMAINLMPSLDEVKEVRLNVNSTVTSNLKLTLSELRNVLGYRILLKDSNFPDTLFNMGVTRSYLFSIDRANPASYGSKRLSLLFEPEPIAPPDVFTARKAKDKVVINWASKFSNSISSFDIEVSQNQRTFKSLGLVKNAGGMNGGYDYSFIDKKPDLGVSYYRLKQINLNGTISYSETKSVDFSQVDTDLSREEIVAYPNPTTDKISVLLKNVQRSDVKATIIDSQGKKLKSQTFKVGEEIIFGTGDFKEGIYLFELHRVNDNKSIGRGKFMVIR